jgi:hypothetical protein
MKPNYSINEILNAVDNILVSKSTKKIEKNNLNEASQILETVNKVHSRKIIEKIIQNKIEETFLLKDYIKEEEDSLKLNNIIKSSDVLILNRLIVVR